MVTKRPSDIRPDSAAPGRAENGKSERRRLSETAVRFLSDLPRERELIEFATESCDRLQIVDSHARQRQLDDAVLRCHCGGRLVALLSWHDGGGAREETAILAEADPADPEALSRQLNSLRQYLTSEEQDRIEFQIVPRWRHDRLALVSPLALYDDTDASSTATRPVGAGATPAD